MLERNAKGKVDAEENVDQYIINQLDLINLQEDNMFSKDQDQFIKPDF